MGDGYGGGIEVGRNSGSYGAAGIFVLTDMAGNSHFLWVDANGKLRINSGGPTAANPASDTYGTIVGTQS